jgi:general secretion pathway protein G
MMLKARKGFTLVELLIVIVIIGILASGMMLASGAATATATATTIISDLKSLQGAAIMYYANSLDANSNADGIDKLYGFMGDSKKISNEEQNYKFVINSHGWWVGYENGRLNDKAVKEKLAAKTNDIGLYNTTEVAANNSFTAESVAVYIKAR